MSEESSEVPLSPGEILALDEEYRRQVEQDKLFKIAPKENNPTGDAWLPILSKRINHARVTLLFSNTDLAHRLGKTHDWVVLYYKPLGGGTQTQCTIVTEWHEGPLEGKRVVRGREDEFLSFYRREGD